jgi:hypothetical protein
MINSNSLCCNCDITYAIAIFWLLSLAALQLLSAAAVSGRLCPDRGASRREARRFRCAPESALYSAPLSIRTRYLAILHRYTDTLYDRESGPRFLAALNEDGNAPC